MVPLLKAGFITKGHAMLGERFFDRRIGIDGGAIRVEDNEPFIAFVHDFAMSEVSHD